MRKKDFKKFTYELLSGKKLMFYHDLPDIQGLNIEAACINWEVRTPRFSVESLADYVASKGVNGHILTKEQYDKLKP